MTNPIKMAAGQPFPPMQWKAVNGNDIAPFRTSGWQVVVVYGGRHCPLCKKYLTTLEALRGAFSEAGIGIAAISADRREQAESQTSECGWRFPVRFGLTVEQMRELGLYISTPRSPEETDHLFAEPALFVINPDGATQIIDVSNAPFSRPDLAALLKGLQFIMDETYPVRGTA